jgi:hypothetical protein
MRIAKWSIARDQRDIALTRLLEPLKTRIQSLPVDPDVLAGIGETLGNGELDRCPFADATRTCSSKHSQQTPGMNSFSVGDYWRKRRPRRQ